ncbi:MAG: neutral zinc metallopeptidase [Planctomycetota bacterium]
MRWKRARESQNVEDRRGSGVPKKAAAMGGGALILVIIASLFGLDPQALLQLTNAAGGSPAAASGTAESSPQEEQLVEFVKRVLGDTEDTWNALFREQGKRYQEPKLVIFRDAVQSACGFQKSATGPFYCPGDHQVYIDLGFYELLRDRLGAPGDFAQAYVIAHEVGHHIQNLLGTSDMVHSRRSQLSETQNNELSVRLELQADYFAGVWAHHAAQRALVEQGDIEEALTAAQAIGDDRLQKKSRGYAVPESFTHGTSEQRMRWFQRGLQYGDMLHSDTFSAKKL